MKRKWPKFLTFKRIVFLSIVLVAAIVLVSYFTGGYVGAKPQYSAKDFTLDGFVSYAELTAPIKVEAEEEAKKLPYDPNDSFADKIEKCKYDAQMSVVIGELDSVIAELNKELANLKKDEEANADAIEKCNEEISEHRKLRSSANVKKLSLPTKEGFIKLYINEKLGYGDTPIMENGSYKFYFDKKWTTFKVVENRTGNVWYSNPQETEDFTTSLSALNQQKAIINLYYAGALGGTTKWDSYTYSVSDTDSSGEKELAPNFQIKEIKDSSGKVTAIQVYYFFEQRGVDYMYFPKFISALKIKDPDRIDLSKEDELPELYLRNKLNTTNGEWEEVVSLNSVEGDSSVKASDDTIWFAGLTAPENDLGYEGSYYVDLQTLDIYVKTTKKLYDTGNDGFAVDKEYIGGEFWQKINTENLLWHDYVKSNVCYNNLYHNAPVYAYAYAGNGAPEATDGLNGFYYFDANTNTVYKKVNGTVDYSCALSAKEMTQWCRSYYTFEDSEAESNTYGYDYFSIKDKYEGMSVNVREKLYAYFYQKCEYSEVDLIADNTEFNQQTISTKGKFGIAIEYALTDTGLSTTILDNSISELKEFPLTTIEILPYFTAAHQTKEGYMLIPDGSGAIMNYNNGKTKYVQYAKSVYTKDLSKMEEIKPTETKDLMFPMYAIVNTNIPGNEGIQSGILADVVSGVSQMRISANISRISDSFNKIFFSAFYRESQKTTIGVGYYATTYTKWTEERLHNDIIINYNFLEQDELNYSAIAKKYRDIIKDRYDIKPNDETKETTLNVSLIGAYDFKNNFLGIVYRDYDAMTTFSQAEEILTDLKAHGANHINAYYLGWRKQGLIDTSFEKIKYSSELGNSSDLESLKTYSQNNDINLYMDVNFGELNNFQESFGQSRYSARDVSGAYVKKYPYDLSTNIYDKKQKATYVLSPRFYTIFMENLVEGYKDKIGLTNLSIKNLGSTLASDYKRHNEIFKHTAYDETLKSLEYAKANGIENLTLYNPYDFAFKYTTNALEVPYEATQYEIFDYSIPFYQLVVSGLFDYSGEVINANDEKGKQWHIMHILETGSNISFTFSYEDSSKLIQTNYKNYYYTQYNKWTEDVVEVLDKINELGIHNAELSKHERIANKVYKVTYTGNTNIEIILNYSDASYEVDGQVIAAKDYIYNLNNSGWRA